MAKLKAIEDQRIFRGEGGTTEHGGVTVALELVVPDELLAMQPHDGGFAWTSARRAVSARLRAGAR